MMRVEVLLFGNDAAMAGGDRVRVDLPQARPTCAQLRQALAEANPALRGQLQTARLAVNHRFVDDDQALRPGDEVALIGMVSGG